MESLVSWSRGAFDRQRGKGQQVEMHTSPFFGGIAFVFAHFFEGEMLLVLRDV